MTSGAASVAQLSLSRSLSILLSTVVLFSSDEGKSLKQKVLIPFTPRKSICSCI